MASQGSRAGQGAAKVNLAEDVGVSSSGIRVGLEMLKVLVSADRGGPTHTRVAHSCWEIPRPRTHKQGKGCDLDFWFGADTGKADQAL